MNDKPDWLDDFEDDELSHFGALTPVIWMGAGAVSFVVLYYGLFLAVEAGDVDLQILIARDDNANRNNSC